MDFELLAELLFPNVTETPQEIEQKYPPRELPEGAKEAYLTNLLEEVEGELAVVDGTVTFTIKPYEIVTLLTK